MIAEATVRKVTAVTSLNHNEKHPCAVTETSSIPIEMQIAEAKANAFQDYFFERCRFQGLIWHHVVSEMMQIPNSA